MLSFEGIPYRERVGFCPNLLPKPVIAGTIPATVVHRNEDETYAWLDEHGRYHVKFNFDLNDSWKKGYSSLLVRLAKPYAGDTYGFHFPLHAHTEV
ncbi:hypothetical protein [Thorsellia anophelis]|uniref:Phage-related baseplate assembly protein n=1 Tax=Thorsellia anophelis DSM 18579 TaxID=1123402 RepID=A0A1I0FTD2_9GAMM|nr:hypothetical protein [Thorsellia anophelis]SET60815.1 Phage-related baseplate assembly protein [Thorsellia anophelis DSM 18579]